ncbi:MAG: hypothetical protein K8R21_11670, partial [Leptospira sp.]|nr:hypothetical protein [Leptospira sp.]
GSKNKSMTLFFEGGNSNEPDPRKEPARKLKRVKSSIKNNNFVEEDSRISEVVDNGPNSTPQHNDKITVFYQHDGNPEFNRPETPTEKGVGKYLMEGVENTKTNPIRNNFKRDYYVKHLDYFDRLFTKIFDYNDRDSNGKYNEANTLLKGTLKY